jgi:hypothetical protein
MLSLSYGTHLPDYCCHNYMVHACQATAVILYGKSWKCCHFISSCAVVCLCSRHFLPVKLYFAPLAARSHTEPHYVRPKASEAHSLPFNVQGQSPSCVYRVCHFEETNIYVVFILKFLLNYSVVTCRENRKQGTCLPVCWVLKVGEQNFRLGTDRWRGRSYYCLQYSNSTVSFWYIHYDSLEVHLSFTVKCCTLVSFDAVLCVWTPDFYIWVHWKLLRFDWPVMLPMSYLYLGYKDFLQVFVAVVYFSLLLLIYCRHI